MGGVLGDITSGGMHGEQDYKDTGLGGTGVGGYGGPSPCRLGGSPWPAQPWLHPTQEGWRQAPRSKSACIVSSLMQVLQNIV